MSCSNFPRRLSSGALLRAARHQRPQRLHLAAPSERQLSWRWRLRVRRRPTPGSVRFRVACHLFINLQRQRRWIGRRPQQLRQGAVRAACRRSRGWRCKLHGQPGCRMRRASKAQSVGSLSRRLAAPLIDPLFLSLSLSLSVCHTLSSVRARPAAAPTVPALFAACPTSDLRVPVISIPARTCRDQPSARNACADGCPVRRGEGWLATGPGPKLAYA